MIKEWFLPGDAEITMGRRRLRKRSTTAVVAKKLGRHYLGYEIVKEYCDMAKERLSRVEAKDEI